MPAPIFGSPGRISCTRPSASQVIDARQVFSKSRLFARIVIATARLRAARYLTTTSDAVLGSLLEPGYNARPFICICFTAAEPLPGEHGTMRITVETKEQAIFHALPLNGFTVWLIQRPHTLNFFHVMPSTKESRGPVDAKFCGTS